MAKASNPNKKHIRFSVCYSLASIALVSLLLPYLFPIHLKEIPISTILYDRNGIVIGDIVPDAIHRHQIIDVELYPQFMVNAIIAIEDKRFWQHNGIDTIALARAAIENIKSSSIVQ